ncbi:MAG TPA: hypothetical protein DCM07_24180, partial [Planctomycetaceae bacterium]|nr:hypothetical protein [Planctomycetaceae bacterium]
GARVIAVTGKFALFRLHQPFFAAKKRYPWTLKLSSDMMRAPRPGNVTQVPFITLFLNSAGSN